MSTKEQTIERISSVVIEPWNVILLNDDWHTFDEVIIQLMKAINCSAQRGAEIALEVHNTGSSICYTGSKERCELVAEILEEIDLKVKLEQA